MAKPNTMQALGNSSKTDRRTRKGVVHLDLLCLWVQLLGGGRRSLGLLAHLVGIKTDSPVCRAALSPPSYTHLHGRLLRDLGKSMSQEV
jgi:hypothetical protein